MKNSGKYILIGILVFVASFALSMPFFGRAAYPYANGFGGGSMMGTWGMHSGFGWFGGLGMIAMWLVPLLTLGLVIAGIVWIVKSISGDRKTE